MPSLSFTLLYTGSSSPSLSLSLSECVVIVFVVVVVLIVERVRLDLPNALNFYIPSDSSTLSVIVM